MLDFSGVKYIQQCLLDCWRIRLLSSCAPRHFLSVSSRQNAGLLNVYIIYMWQFKQADINQVRRHCTLRSVLQFPKQQDASKCEMKPINNTSSGWVPATHISVLHTYTTCQAHQLWLNQGSHQVPIVSIFYTYSSKK